MGATAAVVGASGYAGGELLRLLGAHPEIEIGPCVAHRRAGDTIGQVHPHLSSLASRELTSLTENDFEASDIVFLSLPHGESAAVAATLPESCLVVDLGADYRLESAIGWERYYSGAHAGTWTYGLPELGDARSLITSSRRVASPGCYATAIALAFAPLVAARVVSGEFVVTACSGTSGAGRNASERLLGSEVMGDLTPYKIGGTHQHIPEILQSLSKVGASGHSLSFTPVLAPMPRGILASCSVPLTTSKSTDELREIVAAAYDDETFVQLLPPGQLPHTAATLGSNSVHLQVAAEPDTGRAVVITAIDNLGKGAAGQAIQNANLMLGLPEAIGLPVDGVAP